MSAYNQYLAEFTKLDNAIAQQHSARQLAIESFARFKQLILTNQELLVNFNGVMAELKLVNKYNDIADLENSFSALNALNKNLLATVGKIKTPEIQQQFTALVNYCRNEMTLAEIDNALGRLKTIQAEDVRAE